MKTPHQIRTMEALGRAHFQAIKDELGREAIPLIDEPEDAPPTFLKLLDDMPTTGRVN